MKFKMFFSLFFLSTHFALAAPLPGAKITAYLIRLKPGQDVLAEVESFVKENKLEAAAIVSAVGSLKEASIRYADKDDATHLKGPFEIVSLSGTTAISGSHLHLSISDGSGKTLGGHLMPGSIVYTTLELVIDAYPALKMTRETDATYGYQELVVRKK